MPKQMLPWGALHYEDAGSGPPVFLISGLNGLAATWGGIVSLLSDRFRVITHDHRGLGASDAWTGPYTVAQIASDVLALMDGLGIGRAHVVGHSLGGAVAQAIAIDHPERVAALVIYASWPGPDAYFARLMAMRRSILLHQGVESFVRTGPICIYPPDWIAQHDAAFEAGMPAAMAAFAGVATMQRRMDACLAHDLRGALHRIAAPTLVLGLQDDMSTPAHCSAELAATIPGARLSMLPYGGHNAHLVVPQQVARSVADFLEAQAGRAQAAKAAPLPCRAG